MDRAFKGPRPRRAAKVKGANTNKGDNANEGNDDGWEPSQPLPGVKTDLDEVEKWLTGHEVGADTRAVQVECGEHGKISVTKSSVIENLKNLFWNKQAEVFFWFYSGHADEDFHRNEECDGILLLCDDDLEGEEQLSFEDVIGCFTEAMDEQNGCRGRRLIICLDSCGSGHWVQKLKTAHKQWMSSNADYHVGIQSACHAGEASFDRIFTSTFMIKQRQHKNFHGST